jgi:sugar phosphate permease
MCSVAGEVVGFALRAVRHRSAATMTRPAALMAVCAVVVVFVPSLPVIAVAAFMFGIGLAAFWNVAQTRILWLRPGQAGSVKAVITTLEFGAFGLPILYGAVADAHGVHAGLACYAATACAMAILVLFAPKPTPRTIEIDADDQASNDRAI